MPTRRLLALLLAAAALAAGCGGDDGEEENGGGTPEPAAPAKIADDAKIDGAEGKRIADAAVQLLNAKSGGDACFELAASDYVESLGGQEGCAKKLGPIATGPLDTVVAAGAKPDGETGTAEVESSDGGEKQTIEYAKSFSTDKWNVDGLGE